MHEIVLGTSIEIHVHCIILSYYNRSKELFNRLRVFCCYNNVAVTIVYRVTQVPKDHREKLVKMDSEEFLDSV